MFPQLKDFMNRIFRIDADNVLLRCLKIANIDETKYATLFQRKKLAKNIRASFPYQSVAKTNMLYSELLKILNINIDDLGREKLDNKKKTYFDENGQLVTANEAFFNKDENKYFASKDEFNEYKKEKEKKIAKILWKKVDRSVMKFEVIFNLFWLKAGEAELRGMKHSDVMRVTNKALLGIKKDLEDTYNDAKKELGIKEKNKRRESTSKFHFKNKYSLEQFKKDVEKIKIHYEGEEKILQAIKSFWNDINYLYDKFKELLLISLNEEIDLKKQNKSDEDLIKLTEEKMFEIWNNVEESHKNLQKEILKIQGE